MNKLEKARLKINSIDKQMATLFEERMQAVDDVVSYKIEHDLQVLDISREQTVIEKNCRYILEDSYRPYYETFIQDVMKISRSYQKKKIHKDMIAYAGIKGAFSHIAAMKVFPDATYLNFPTFEDVAIAVRNGEVAYGILPFENSYTGEVGENMDILMEYDLYIHNMYDMNISQNLLGLKGATLQDIKQVYSKDHAVSQSKKFLEGRGYELISYPNTALAAEYIAKQQDFSKAAIASKETASIYGLQILANDINTASDNTTRFVIVANECKVKGDHIALVFTIHHQAGALANVMDIIRKHDVNMESIHSRSIKDTPFAYYFYVELIANMASNKVQALLSELHAVCESVKIIGVYEKESRDK